MRACILGVIPEDIVDKALHQCIETLADNSQGPLKDCMSAMLKSFKERFKVTQEMIEVNFGYKTDTFTEIDYVEHTNIGNSIIDGMSKVEMCFKFTFIAKLSTKIQGDIMIRTLIKCVTALKRNMYKLYFQAHLRLNIY